jgi:uncharacterized membrane protein YczE
LFGVSLTLMVRARLGLGPWDVLHQGIARLSGLAIGWVVIGVGALVLLAWIPLRQRPGVGTVANVVIVGLSTNLTLAFLPTAPDLLWQLLFLCAGILANGIATALYIGAGLGAGPRDGLMLGLARLGVPLPVARTCIELTVLVIGATLGGSVGVGTLAYALSIGPLAGFFLPRLAHKVTRPIIPAAIDGQVPCPT